MTRDDGSRDWNGAPSSNDGLIPDERARQALRRAAELQAEAAARLQETARGQLMAQAAQPTETDGFRRMDVEAAAVEAGISPEYIRQALVEQDALGEHAEELTPWVEKMGRRMLKTTARSLEVSRVIDADPARVLEAMQRIFPAHPYLLALEDNIGGPPLAGGVLVFQIPRLMATTTNYTPFSYTAATIDVLQLHATLRTIPGPGGSRCELSVRTDLRTGTRRNVWTGVALSGTGGALGAGATAAIAVAASAALPVIAVAAVAGLGILGIASSHGYGAMYRYYLRKMEKELEQLLKVVDASARTGGGFRAPTPPSSSIAGWDGMNSVLNSI
ncbi:hypothetical protein FHS01_002805 [Longimicrobium terrae]|nr:hypothetical protein [Longimicrobium terrae]